MPEIIKSVNVDRTTRKAWIREIPIQSGAYQHYDLRGIADQVNKSPVHCLHRTWESRNYHAPEEEVVRLFKFYSTNARKTRALLSRTFQPNLSTPLGEETGKFFAIVSDQIHVGVESPEEVEATIKSLAEAAELIGPVLVMPYLNYVEPGVRNEGAERQALREQAEEMARIMLDAASGSNLSLQTIIHALPSQQTWAQRRNVMYGLALEMADQGVNDASDRWHTIDRTSYLQFDTDSTMSPSSLVAIREALNEEKAIFVSGTLHYTSGIMEKTPREVAEEKNIGTRLLYFVEMMRRRMFDHLEPLSPRGYVTELGFAGDMGTIATLGGFDERDSQNESYLMMIKAVEAWMRQMEVSISHPNYPDAYIASKARKASGVICHLPRSMYALDSSIAGLEGMVGESGPIVLVDFDQGRFYKPRTEQAISQSQRREPVREPSKDELLTFLSAVYSAFKNRGGSLLQEDGHRDRDIETLQSGKVSVEAMNLQELAAVLFPQLREQDVPGARMIFWRFIEEKEDDWRTEKWPKGKWPIA